MPPYRQQTDTSVCVLSFYLARRPTTGPVYLTRHLRLVTKKSTKPILLSDFLFGVHGQ